MEAVYALFCILLLLVFQGCSKVAVSQSSKVEFLPGFQGPLPFELETGYVGLGEEEDVQLFYYFVKSQGNPKEDPLLLWLTGGPGCSAVSGLLYEIGPLNFEVVEYHGSLPTLVLNPYSWTKVASIIFVDSPVGTGFSYATTQLASLSGDFLQINQVDDFFRKWLTDHPEFVSSPVYVGGDSFSGLPLPALIEKIINGNEEGSKPFINFKGYLVGNAVTDVILDGNSPIPYAHGMGLISDELYESLEKSCRGQYVIIDPRNSECLNHMEEYHKCTSGLDAAHILEPFCVFASPKPIEISFHKRRSLNQKFLNNFADSDPPLPTIGCRTYSYLLSKYWMDDKSVQKALNVREGTVREWQRCNYGIPYKHEIFSSVKYHLNIGNKGYRSIIYSGDHDMLIPFVGTEAWIRSLNVSIIDEWRPWHLDFQIAGYTRTYANRMTFATIKGGGHTAPEYKPAECFAMFKRWISEEHL
ncbi:serine carboxypeptidase-like 7 [Euphorbia lathyris]|uniref:serine carboxypeptidase-like 7 n=1 Tax=Euphorbia lathyris TaxID=212925 RepID=UPI00331411EE